MSNTSNTTETGQEDPRQDELRILSAINNIALTVIDLPEIKNDKEAREDIAYVARYALRSVREKIKGAVSTLSSTSASTPPTTGQTLVMAGRHTESDIVSLFDHNPSYLTASSLDHQFYIIFLPQGDQLHMKYVHSGRELLKYDDQVQVMIQWPGQWRSDFFYFTVGDVRHYARQNGIRINP